VLSKVEKDFDDTLAVGGREAFDVGRAALGREGAHPDFFNGRIGGPEIDEVRDIAVALHHRAGDGAVDGDVLSLNVAQDALVGCGLAARVVLGL
jgi:hypothetical protein